MIVRFLKHDAAFGPEDILAMSEALADVCNILELPKSAKSAREVIAERIIELASSGERDPAVLRDRVLDETGLSGERRWSGM